MACWRRPMVSGLLLGLLACQAKADEPYREEVEAWRQRRAAELEAEDGWLTLAGLHWLSPGPTQVGGGLENTVRLPEGAPARVGVLDLEGDRVQFRAEPGVVVTRGGEPFVAGEIRTDAQGKPDVLSVGAIRLIVIRRGVRHALRVKDNHSPVRTQFAGLRWFPIDDSWRIAARFEPASLPSRIEVETIVGTRESFESPGSVVFGRDGKEHRLQAALEGEKLWFVFRDATAGRTTSANGRELLADRPGPDGVVILDFNRAVNLPCAYTPFATCPMPPKQNQLEIAIPAGEQRYVPTQKEGRATPH